MPCCRHRTRPEAQTFPGVRGPCVGCGSSARAGFFIRLDCADIQGSSPRVTVPAGGAASSEPVSGLPPRSPAPSPARASLMANVPAARIFCRCDHLSPTGSLRQRSGALQASWRGRPCLMCPEVGIDAIDRQALQLRCPRGTRSKMKAARHGSARHRPCAGRRLRRLGQAHHLARPTRKRSTGDGVSGDRHCLAVGRSGQRSAGGFRSASRAGTRVVLLRRTPPRAALWE